MGLAVEDDEVCRLFLDWLPFETSLGEMTFGDYRQATDRVRYVPNVDAFRQIARVAAAQNLPVINAGYLHDAELLAKVPDVFPHLTVESVDSTTVTQDFDDLTDADWPEALAFTPPADLPSDAYGLELRQGEQRDVIPFFVLPSPRSEPAPLALLVPTFSYLAYANERHWWTNPGVEAIAGKQTPDTEKRARADFIVETGEGLDAARAQVRHILKTLREDSRWRDRF